MARTLHVYPKATITDASWTYICVVGETNFVHVVAAGITTERTLELHKLVIDLDTSSGPGPDTDEDVDDALFKDDIQPGPQTLTAWEDWQGIAEGIIDDLTPGYTEREFWEAWTGGDTQAMRQSLQRALVSGPGGSGRGWTITGFHQHEGDGTVNDG